MMFSICGCVLTMPFLVGTTLCGRPRVMLYRIRCERTCNLGRPQRVVPTSQLWIASGQHQACALFDAEHQVHVLHGLARRAFDEIVYRHEDDHCVVLCSIADVNEVRAL